MKLIADAMIDLPFTLDFCAIGPDVLPLTCEIDSMQATLFFPPSLGAGTDGKGIYGDWAWWTGRSLRLVLEREVESVDDYEMLRDDALAAGNTLLRRFLNAYRVRFQRPDVHPLRIDRRVLNLETVDDAGHTQALPEPISAFFYNQQPSEPPLDRSINALTLDDIEADVQSGIDPDITVQMELDADALDLYGEPERAALLREAARRQSS